MARRDGPRIDVRLRVRYQADVAHGEAEASDVSPRGLRLESDEEVPVGAHLTLMLDAGDANEQLEAVGRVMWCKPHLTPTNRQVFDVGVQFEKPWATPERGALGRALARVFAMAESDVGGQFEKIPAALRMGGRDVSHLILTDVAVTALQFRALSPLDELQTTGRVVRVELTAEGATTTLDGRVMWLVVQGGQGGPRRARDTFGVQLLEVSGAAKALLERIRLGQTVADQIRILA